MGKMNRNSVLSPKRFTCGIVNVESLRVADVVCVHRLGNNSED